MRIRSQEKKINERVFILGHDKDLKDLVQIANNVVISEIRRRVEGGGNLTSRCSGHWAWGHSSCWLFSVVWGCLLGSWLLGVNSKISRKPGYQPPTVDKRVEQAEPRGVLERWTPKAPYLPPKVLILSMRKSYKSQGTATFKE